MKIYTKTGDKGQTSLIGGERVAKNHIRLQAYGTVDELNSFLGLLRAKVKDPDIKQIILEIQNNLFTIGANLATNNITNEVQKFAVLEPSEVEKLENLIDKYDKILPKLTNFIIYGENELSATCHVCRAIARRAEREILAVYQEFSSDEIVGVYVNRLSDFLFILARFFDFENKNDNFFWEK